MVCVICSKEQYSNPSVKSDWRCIELDKRFFYVCLEEFPPNESASSEFKKAYQLAIACCLNELVKEEGGTPQAEIEAYQQAKRQETRNSFKTVRKGKGFSC